MESRSFLLDTNILLHALLEPERLPQATQADLSNAGNRVICSVASLWEIAIKASLNRPDFNFSSADIEALAIETGFELLPILPEHCHEVAALPWHHRDPFDRLLVAQTLRLPAYLLTTDRLLPPYSSLIRLIAI
ncbi:type II toxin-antitoxin system VapC family toxin [Gammaproteobacteria bacterium 2W06]|nr:type II toxin-antitoxin system VapC family toxin [Gammaproteobacteria bacterium 2W06]